MNKERLNFSLLANSMFNVWPPLSPFQGSFTAKRKEPSLGFQLHRFPTPVPNLPFTSSVILDNCLNDLSFNFLIFKIEVLVSAECC